MKYRYADQKNQVIGPIDEAYLTDLFSKGEVNSETYIIPEGGDQWETYSSLFPVYSLTRAEHLPPLPTTVRPRQAVSESEPMQRCPYCSELVYATAKKCKHCGEILDVALRAAEQARQSNYSNQPTIFMNAGGGGGGSSSSAASVSPAGGMEFTNNKSRLVAALLAFFLGWIGIHKFYLGHPVMGIIYIIFSFTLIPMLISWIEGIIYLLSSKRGFAMKYG
ncbi:NINE protein [Lamprobacter modestohalophilus]|uniref:NINE protein n=1 Tax=Lamprobacter modestohalophilus TaxID=1064514 RepID=UPI002ADEDD23|nr:NINE protein [Lamprobacter modestohalophilus]MEA1048371.1 NINE protein [Lamprobacter modestohalophilus]